MSVNLMSAIFETEFFDIKDENGNVTKASTAKLVLLAMADHANDEGEGSYPSVERLCRKTALSEQTIRNTFDALRYNGVIELAGKSKYGTNNHTINTKSFPKAIGKEVTSLTLYPLGGSNEYLKGSNQSPLVTLPIRPESLLNKQETSNTLTARDFQEAGEKVEKIIALSKGGADAWRGRELIPAHLLKYADWWNSKSGQIMRKMNKEWGKAFDEWYSNEITIDTLDEAYQLEIAWKKVIAKPSELTAKAIAIQALPKPYDKAQQNAITTEGGFYVT